MRHLPWWNVKCLANDTTELAILPMTTKFPRAMWMNQKTKEAFLAIFRSMIYRCVSTRATLPKTKRESSLKILAVGSEIYNSDDFHKKLRARSQFREISVHPTEPNLKKINYEWGKKEIFSWQFRRVGVVEMIINYTLKVVVKFAQCTQINTTLLMRLKNTFFIRVFDFASLFSCMKKTFMTETFFTPKYVVGGALSGGKTSNEEKTCAKKAQLGRSGNCFSAALVVMRRHRHWGDRIGERHGKLFSVFPLPNIFLETKFFHWSNWVIGNFFW